MPTESQIKIEARAQELVTLELTRQKLRQEKLQVRRGRSLKQQKVIIFRKINDKVSV
ncbi:hypothetical protein PN451_19780 [Dolichospermum planctonicum CS-1226]|uniref:Transposase n=1 Tax=Dolichospermum planctonicum CS-1226 TaxID=3021751 RepID=A0ABT5AL77_9CYAN|nr:hypothetical protein [Dolichospermum planctonicum]MDB9538045.1 hypothetical protein [Dolichospermum planctonicum CS-1226]